MLDIYKNNKYSDVIELTYAAFTPRQSVFFMPLRRMRAENTKYQPKRSYVASIESATCSVLGGNTEEPYAKEIETSLQHVFLPTSDWQFLLSSYGWESANILNKHNPLLSDVSISRSPINFETEDNKMTNIVTFHNHNIELISHNKQPYMALSQIGIALEYANPIKVSKLYNQHKEEFDEEMSCLIKRGNTRIRIFNREGAWLIGMLSRTPKAAEFRKWVLKVLGSVSDNSQPTNSEQLLLTLKSCISTAVQSEISKFFTFNITTNSECSDRDLLYWLYRWHSTRNKEDTLKFRQLTRENEVLKIRLATVKKAVQ